MGTEGNALTCKNLNISLLHTQSQVSYSEDVKCTIVGKLECPCSMFANMRATVPRPPTTTILTTLSPKLFATCVRAQLKKFLRNKTEMSQIQSNLKRSIDILS